MAYKFGVILTLVSATLALASALPNIKIQVNTENNLKNAPYLLEEAAKRQEAFETVALDPLPVPQGAQAAAAASESSQSGPPTLIKEETVEEILDLAPESVIKLAPQSLISSASQAFHSQGHTFEAAAAAPAESPAPEASSEPLALQTAHETGPSHSNGRKPVSQQLPVANSHLKKPATSQAETGNGDGESEAGSGAATFSGLKSLVSPTILLDAPTSSGDADKLQKKASQSQPPDVWEPSQVMSGVSNVSLVPAIVNRDYGTHSRTRVTLGGGYQRDRQPEPEDPATSSESQIRSANSQKQHQEKQPQIDSHLIEVPERIVLPASSSSSSSKPPAGLTIVASSSSSSSGPQQVATSASATPPPGRKQKLDPRCPKQGVMTFEHPKACDKYFYCEDGYVSEQTCPNGLLYGTRDTVRDYCVHRWKANCEEKLIPNPISSPGCRWQFGIFSVQGSPKCTPDFYECIEGRFEVRKCPIDGQVYDDRTKSCQYSEAVGCAQEALGDFQCPPDDQGNTYWPFPRYFLNERALIHCVNDKPEIVRCTGEERVDPEHLHCVPVGKLQAKSDGQAANIPAALQVPAERRPRERKKPEQKAASSSSSSS